MPAVENTQRSKIAVHAAPTMLSAPFAISRYRMASARRLPRNAGATSHVAGGLQKIVVEVR
jgi:hypothetical protein